MLYLLTSSNCLIVHVSRSHGTRFKLFEDFLRYDWLSKQAVPLIGQLNNYDLIMISGGWVLVLNYDLSHLPEILVLRYAHQ